jgi:hypothetical protein
MCSNATRPDKAPFEEPAGQPPLEPNPFTEPCPSEAPRPETEPSPDICPDERPPDPA